MSDHNLNIAIVADSTKARAEFELLKAKANELRRELGALTREAARTGGGQMTPEILAATRAVEGAEKGIRTYRAETAKTAEANKITSKTFTELGKSIGEFAKASGFATEGMKALKFGIAGFVVTQIIRGAAEAVDALNKLNSAARGIGVGSQFLRSMQTIARQIGDDPAIATGIAAAFNKAWQQSAFGQLQRRGFAPPTNQGQVQVFRGGAQREVMDEEGNMRRVITTLRDFQQVMRGGVRGVQFDLSDPIGFILGRPLDLKNKAADMQAVAKAILEVKDATLQAELAQRVYNTTFEQAQPYIERQARGEMPEVKEPTDRQQQALNQYNEALAASHDKWEEINQTLGLMAADAATQLTNLSNIKASLSGAATTHAMEPSALPFSTAPAPIEATLQAAGGFIRGPGTGTSDSIPAWLSNGEYVINAASVRRLGTGFLHSLNHFSLGGFVGPMATRFAEGGLAGSTSGGTPVHLHLNGNTFPMHASANVAGALVIEAKRQQMTSAGTKPSWYGR